jgi:multidrug transporter EmrE-like cation transporter
MKKKLFLIAGICFYLAAVSAFLTAVDDKAIAIAVFGTIGTAFIAIYNIQKKSPNRE